MKAVLLFSFVVFICYFVSGGFGSACSGEAYSTVPNSLPLSLLTCIDSLIQNEETPSVTATLSQTLVTIDNFVNYTSYIEITDIYPGATYQFTTCASGSSPAGFNPFLVLTYPDGTILDYSDNCLLSGISNAFSCSSDGASVEFTHNNPQFTSFHLNILAYPENGKKPVCLFGYQKRAVAVYMQTTTNIPCNNFYLQCAGNDVEYALNSDGDTYVIINEVTIPPTSLCGTDYLISKEDGQNDGQNSGLYFGCDDVGYHIVDVDTYAGSCQTRVRITDDIVPTPYTCPVDSSFLVEGNNDCGPNADLLRCFVQLDRIPFEPFVFDDNCDLPQTKYKFSQNSIEVGETVRVTGSVVDVGGNKVSTTCSLTPVGLHLLVRNGENFYANNYYEIYFNFYQNNEALIGLNFVLVPYPGVDFYFDVEPSQWYRKLSPTDRQRLLAYEFNEDFAYFYIDDAVQDSGNTYVAYTYLPQINTGTYILVAVAATTDSVDDIILGYTYPIVYCHGADYIHTNSFTTNIK